MKTSNIEPSGQRSAAATRGSRSTNLAGAKGMVWRDAVTESSGQIRDMTVLGFTFIDNEDGTGILENSGVAGAGSYPSFPVTTFGAVGDGTTDDTAAINDAIAALNATGTGILYFPATPNAYYVTAGLDPLTVPCRVMGDGRLTSADGPVSRIACDSTTAVLLTLEASGSTICDLALDNVAAGAKTAGAGLYLENAVLSTMDNLVVNGFWINIDIENGGVWSLHGSYLASAKKYGLRIRNDDDPDGGDQTVSDCYFGAGTVASDAAIRYQSGGGLKIVNTKFNGDPVSAGFLVAIDIIPDASVVTSICLISNCSIENVRGDAVKLTTVSGTAWSLISMTGTQVALYDNDTGYALNVLAANVGEVHDVIVDGCLFLTDGTARAAVSLTKANLVYLGDYQLDGFNARYTSSGSTNVTDASAPVGRVRHVLPDGYSIADSAGGANLGINGGTVAVAIHLSAPLHLDKLAYRNGDTGTARAIEFGLFRDDGSANAMCIAKGSDSFTPPGAASVRAPAFTSAPILVPPGEYWFVVRNTGGATNFQFSFVSANAANIGLVGLQSKTLAGALPAVGATLDLSGSWTRTSVNMMAFALIGRVFAEGSAF